MYIHMCYYVRLGSFKTAAKRPTTHCVGAQTSDIVMRKLASWQGQ
jgi:hypothetical protein